MIFIFIVSTMSHQLRQWNIFILLNFKGIIILSFKLHSYYIKEVHKQLLLDTARGELLPKRYFKINECEYDSQTPSLSPRLQVRYA